VYAKFYHGLNSHALCSLQHQKHATPNITITITLTLRWSETETRCLLNAGIAMCLEIN